MGVSGESLREALLTLRPEIYGAIAEEKSELQGLLYFLELWILYVILALSYPQR